MYAVAVTRLRGMRSPHQSYRETAQAIAEPSRDDVVRVLASITGVDPADWRMRIGRPLPWVIAMDPDDETARERTTALRSAGLGAVWCDVQDARAWAPRGHASVLFEEHELGFLEDPRRIPYAAVRATILAMLDAETATEEISHAPTVAPREGQPPLLVSSYKREGVKSKALYLVLGGGEPLVRLEQSTLRLVNADGTIALGGTSRVRFDRAVDEILRRTEGAVRDTRLLTARRGRSSFATRGDGVTQTSNVRETELVAHLIGLAWRENQIDPA